MDMGGQGWPRRRSGSASWCALGATLGREGGVRPCAQRRCLLELGQEAQKPVASDAWHGSRLGSIGTGRRRGTPTSARDEAAFVSEVTSLRERLSCLGGQCIRVRLLRLSCLSSSSQRSATQRPIVDFPVAAVRRGAYSSPSREPSIPTTVCTHGLRAVNLRQEPSEHFGADRTTARHLHGDNT